MQLSWSRSSPYISIQCHLANRNEGEVLVWPDLGNIKGHQAGLLGLLRLHNLNVETPDRVVLTCDRIEQFRGMVIGIGTSKACSFVFGEIADALLGAEVELAVIEGSIGSDQLEGVETKTSNTADGGGDTAGAEQMKKTVDTLGAVDMEIPELVLT